VVVYALIQRTVAVTAAGRLDSEMAGLSAALRSVSGAVRGGGTIAMMNSTAPTAYTAMMTATGVIAASSSQPAGVTGVPR